MDSLILTGPKDESNIPKESLGKYFLQCLQRREANDIIVIDAVTKTKLTCGKLLQDSINLSKAFEKLPLIQGDVISIISENVINYYVPVLASLLLGVVVNPLNPDYLEGELQHAITIAKPKLLICSKQCLQKALKLQEQFAFIEHVILFSSSTTESNNLESIEKLVKLNSVRVSTFKPREFDYSNQEALILMSSGTTGLPKGVLLTHKNLRPILVYLSHPNYGNVTSNDWTVQFVPNFHIYGVILQSVAICFSLKIVMMNKFDPELYLKCIEEYKANKIFLVPTILGFLVNSPLTDKYDLSSIRDIICAASPISENILKRAIKKFDHAIIRQAYGLTEIGGLSNFQTMSSTKIGCVGSLVPEITAMVWCSETNEMLGPLKSGELCFKGPSLMKSYVGNTQEMNEITDDNGFFHTGDQGYYDEDHVFYVVDRIKELIKYKGFQVPPAELEALIMTHPAVNDCGVIGIPDERAGEVPLAYIVPKANFELTEKDIIQFVAGESTICIENKVPCNTCRCK